MSWQFVSSSIRSIHLCVLMKCWFLNVLCCCFHLRVLAVAASNYFFLIVVKWQVRIIKCIVDIFVVDISFNQLSGLCALCFFEEVIFFYTSSQFSTIFLIFQRSLTNYLFFQINALISHDHLFKRSIILIKAWCYYESRILGSNHGLISTYALEILVLYIFNLYNNRFSGPLEVTNLFFFWYIC